MCEFDLGRQSLEMLDGDGEDLTMTSPSAKSIDEIVACLKRIRKSIDMWTRECGRRGYCDFIDGIFSSADL